MSERAGTVYLAHIRDQWAEQRDREKSLVQRGQTSVAVSGALVTLLLAFSDIGALRLAGSPSVTRWLAVALVLLVIGAIVGVLVTVPLRYPETKVAGMRGWLPDEHWTQDVRYGEQAVAKNVLDVMERARTRNQARAWLLTVSVSFQVLGVAVVAARLMLS